MDVLKHVGASTPNWALEAPKSFVRGPVFLGIQTFLGTGRERGKVVDQDGQDVLSRLDPAQQKRLDTIVARWFAKDPAEEKPEAGPAYTAGGTLVAAAASASPKLFALATAAQTSTRPTTPISTWSQSQIQNLTTSDIANLSASDIAALSPTQTSWFTTAQVPLFSSAQIQEFSTAQVAAFKTVEVGALTSAQVATLTNAQAAVLSLQQINSISTTALVVHPVYEAFGLACRGRLKAA